MQQYLDTIQDRAGNVIPGATVTVTTYPGGATASTYATNAIGSSTNPITADNNGQYSFYAIDGSYTVTTSKSGIITSTKVITLSDNENGISITGFGAVGDGAADDTVALQAAFDAALAANVPLTITDGCNFYTPTGVSVNGMVNLVGKGAISTAANIPLITYNVNTTSVNKWYIDGPSFIGPASTNSSSCAIRFTGDNVSFVQFGYARFNSSGFNAVVKDEKTARVTGFGLESMLNWNTWDVKIVNAKTYGFWYTQGSGTGSVYRGSIVTNDAGSAAWFFDGNGCAVGDVVFAGVQLGCQTAGGIGVKIGASTVYRAQWCFAGIQFDANCDVPISMSGTGSTLYTNWTISGIAWGGNAELGATIQPLVNSVVCDRDTSHWQAGNYLQSSTVGAISTNAFTIDFASFGAIKARIHANGVIGGVGACSSYTDVEIVEGSGSLTRTYSETYIGRTNGFDVSVSVSGTTATVTVACTSSSTGTGWNTTIDASGNGFKITRA